MQTRLQRRRRHRGEIDIAGDQRLVRQPAAHQYEVDFETFLVKVAAVARNIKRTLGHVDDRNSHRHLARLARHRCGEQKQQNNENFHQVNSLHGKHRRMIHAGLNGLKALTYTLAHSRGGNYDRRRLLTQHGNNHAHRRPRSFG